ncbi:MAG: UDP-glucose 4-epimerase [Candidatus Nealsonbacteria bacterium RBG_13_42_11]|uniref:UDP-glucose 4-epimerase n=1 Tax=Candidatus Nealsonbacteria bacterium RBG_13_42_11 TaxID=1801663 RepID=A0A1G2DZV2_9BACT|nr:MAG: UDP-glucose 4-epimerase [Candidatus Nealsonbacteria bacterium RBG_13_42_11]
MIKKQTYLITGGAGFIGSHLADELIKTGGRVIIVDNLSAGKKENVNKKAVFYKRDILDPKLAAIFKKERPDIIFHYAAQIDVRKSTKDPIGDAKINILGTINVLENCRNFKVGKIIFASSVGVYGEPEFLPTKENHPLGPISPYPITKLTVEKYLSYYKSLGLDFAALRYSNIYGPRQSSSGEGGVVSIFIDNLLNGKKSVIYGNGEQTRDFLYVADAVKAALLALKAPSGSIYNVGTGKETSINKLYKLIFRDTGNAIHPKKVPPRFGEIKKSCLNSSKIKKELNWRPKWELEEGLKETRNWFKNKN